MVDALYWLMVAAFATHELDAIKRREWRVLPLTSFLPKRVGAQVFIWMHLPLFFAIFWFSLAGPASGFVLGLSVFTIIHVGLHWLLRRHPAYEFNNISSWSLIVPTGVLGAALLIAVGVQRGSS